MPSKFDQKTIYTDWFARKQNRVGAATGTSPGIRLRRVCSKYLPQR